MANLRFAIVIPLVAVAFAVDPCANYTDIGFPYRSSAFRAGTDLICDMAIVTGSDWYRFDQHTGGEIPEECPYPGFCGTQAPIWMKGSHPTDVGVTETVQACTNYGVTCCDIARDMEVMLCDVEGEQFYVYKLPPVPDCPTAYCAGDKMPCERYVEVWDEDKEMCVPKHQPTTEATGHIHTTDKNTEEDPNKIPLPLIIGACIGAAGIVAIIGAISFVLIKKHSGAKVHSKDITRESTPPPPYDPTIHHGTTVLVKN